MTLARAIPMGAALLQSTLAVGFVYVMTVNSGPMIDAEKHPTWEWIGGWTGLLQILVILGLPLAAASMLWMGRRAGWWLSLACDFLAASETIFCILGDLASASTLHLYVKDLLLFHSSVLLAVIVSAGLLLLPQSRQFFRVCAPSIAEPA